MGKTCLKYFFVFCLLIVQYKLSAQYTGKPFVINYSRDVYDGQSQNWSIAKTDDGILYVGNNEGLIEFDGSNWDIYYMPEDMLVRAVAIGDNNKVFVGAYEEFGYFQYNDEGLFIYHSLSEKLKQDFFHNDEIWRIITKDTKVYFQSFSSVYLYERGEISRIDPEGTIVLLIESEDRLFIHKVNKGLFELKNDELVLLEGGSLVEKDEIKAVLKLEEDKYIFGGSSGGLFLFEHGHIEKWNIPIAKSIQDAEINNAILLKDYIVIGTIVNGIYILDKSGNLIDHLNSSNFLQNNTVLSLCAAGEDKFWAGLDRGLDYISLNNSLDIYIEPSGSSSTVYDAIFHKNKLYVATNQGVFKYDFNLSTGFNNPVLIEGSQGQVWDLCVHNDQLLCGHTNGTYRIDENKVEQISTVNGGFEIKKVIWGNNEYLLQSSYSMFSIFKKGIKNWEFSHTVQGFVEPVAHFELDHLGNIWASHTNMGVYRLRPNQNFTKFTDIRYFGKDNGLITDRKIKVTKIENRIAFCTRKFIYTYDDLSDKIIPYNYLNDGLGIFKASDRIINAGSDQYWCVMENRIALFEIKAGAIRKIFDYDFNSSGAWMSGNFPNIATLNDSSHFICLDNGFAIYRNNKSVQKKSYLTTNIRKVGYYLQKDKQDFYINPSEEIEYAFKFQSRNLKFIYSASEISVDRYFSVKMEGLDDHWGTWTLSSEKDYTRLPSGEYSFRVKSRGENGDISQESIFQFKILRPWYFSYITILVYVLIIVSLAVFLRVSFKKRLISQTRKLREEENEKRRRDSIALEQNLTKVKNEKLRAELSHKSMQLANYTMTLLRKNELLIKIRKEISQQKTELGGRYPNYYFEKIVKMIDANISTEDDWKVFEMHFDLAHENFFKRLKEEYNDLTPSDLKLCAYLRLNLNTKEIAPLLNISVRGIEIRRYRLRKRLNLNTEDNLINFLLSY